MLDLFCHLGGFGLAAAANGASEVLCVDSSAASLELVQKSAKKNRVSTKVKTQEADIFKWLDELPAEEMFDIIILDPPALAKNKGMLREAMRGYAHLNEKALAHLNPGGLLATFSCSSHVTGEMFYDMLVNVRGRTTRPLVMVEPLGQAPDHPILIGLRETQYLKGWIVVG